MRQYKTLNNLVGWLVFAVAAVVYCMTVEPTVSFWDCGEFILTGDKLEIGHPPGAPVFMLMSNFVSLFAADATKVALMINIMSALMSAACILFLFWTITHLVRKLVIETDNDYTLPRIIVILGSGVVGALAYAFSDTFWFSAVEAEVYATSSMFTALVFWLILKWEDCADQPHSDRWLVLIAYLTGLSIGVHLLNLLCLPAIVLVYYYKKKPDANLKGSLLALAVSALLVAVVLYGIVPGVIKVAGRFELFTVNTLGLPFNSGVLLYVIVVAAALVWAVYETYAQRNHTRAVISFLLTVALLGIPFYGHGASSILIGIVVLGALAYYLLNTKVLPKYRVSMRTLNTTMLCLTTIMIGYSSYALIIIRSSANTPMDQNSPEDVFTLGEYLGREQYGTRPLFYGHTFASQPQMDIEGDYCVPRYTTGAPRYIRQTKNSPDEKDKYKEEPGRPQRVYAQNMLFPRMYNTIDPSHAAQYKSWSNMKGHTVPYNQCGQLVSVTVPTQLENLRFFFSYQLNFMYWRYFLWNFVGRQNDIQGFGEIEHGNWVTGFKFIDNALVGDQELTPTILKENKGHNVYYGLPLLLGIVGLFWQAYRRRKGVQQFWIVFFLFFMTGIAIILYLNQTPLQVRERDYAYAGSFYAFAIWIGMSVAAVAKFLVQRMKLKELPAAAVATALCVLVPLQMVSQTWDDHDRSHRYIAHDVGQNYLSSLPESGNPIIYTNGDNDTFPLWYNQEVEAWRTDARTCNLSYLATDWYIDQMKRPAYDSPALPIRWSRAEYMEGVNDAVAVEPSIMPRVVALYADSAAHKGGVEVEKGEGVNPQVLEAFGENPYELHNILDKWVRKGQPIPTDSIVLKVDKEAVRRSGMIIPAGDTIPDYMHISLKGKRWLQKNELMILEMLANTNWERPIFYAITVGRDVQLNMENHFVQEGLVYRITPFDTKKSGITLDADKMYDNLMNKFKYGNLNRKGIYIDENSMRMCNTHRRLFAQLLDNLLAKGDKERATAALAKCEEMIPAYNVPYAYDNGGFSLAEAYYQLGQTNEGDRVAGAMATDAQEYVTWYLSMSDAQIQISYNELVRNLSILDELVRMMETYKSEQAAFYSEQFKQIYQIVQMRLTN